MSYHVAYVGQSGSGKTFAAKTMSRMMWAAEKRPSIVFDPRNDGTWGPQALVFKEKARIPAFWAFVASKKNCAVFVDEVLSVMPRDGDASEKFTQIRHDGHQLHMLLHVGKNLLPEQRDQCGTLLLFNQHISSLTMFAEEWNDPRILEARSLMIGEFLFCRRTKGVPPFLHQVEKRKLTA